MRKTLFLLLSLSFLSAPLQAIENDSLAADSAAMDSLIQDFMAQMSAYKEFKDSLDNSLQFENGQVNLQNGLATLNVPDQLMYLDTRQASQVLTEVWNNPPQSTLIGMMIPKGTSVLDDSTYAILISYEQEGYVDDEDAEDLDYDELLETMQEDAIAGNPERSQLGYPTIEIIGWASPPYYDSQSKKLHWAKELSFDGDSEHTLNYNVRILGRRGYLELNFIGGLYLLDQIKKDMPAILKSVEFNSGNQYGDFDPDIDEVAAYGIGGLIAGKVLAKAGFFALILKFWKIIAVGAVGLFAGLRRFLGGKKKEEEQNQIEEPKSEDKAE